MRWGRLVMLAVVVATLAPSGPVSAEAPAHAARPTLEPSREATTALRRLPLHFEENLDIRARRKFVGLDQSLSLRLVTQTALPGQRV